MEQKISSTDIRLKTAIVICRNNMYLVGRGLAGNLRWSNYVYDAWKTRNVNKALYVAIKVKGRLMLFNSVTGQTKLV